MVIPNNTWDFESNSFYNSNIFTTQDEINVAAEMLGLSREELLRQEQIHEKDAAPYEEYLTFINKGEGSPRAERHLGISHQVSRAQDMNSRMTEARMLMEQLGYKVVVEDRRQPQIVQNSSFNPYATSNTTQPAQGNGYIDNPYKNQYEQMAMLSQISEARKQQQVQAPNMNQQSAYNPYQQQSYYNPYNAMQQQPLQYQQPQMQPQYYQQPQYYGYNQQPQQYYQQPQMQQQYYQQPQMQQQYYQQPQAAFNYYDYIPQTQAAYETFKGSPSMLQGIRPTPVNTNTNYPEYVEGKDMIPTKPINVGYSIYNDPYINRSGSLNGNDLCNHTNRYYNANNYFQSQHVYNQTQQFDTSGPLVPNTKQTDYYNMNDPNYSRYSNPYYVYMQMAVNKSNTPSYMQKPLCGVQYTEEAHLKYGNINSFVDSQTNFILKLAQNCARALGKETTKEEVLNRFKEITEPKPIKYESGLPDVPYEPISDPVRLQYLNNCTILEGVLMKEQIKEQQRHNMLMQAYAQAPNIQAQFEQQFPKNTSLAEFLERGGSLLADAKLQEVRKHNNNLLNTYGKSDFMSMIANQQTIAGSLGALPNMIDVNPLDNFNRSVLNNLRSRGYNVKAPFDKTLGGTNTPYAVPGGITIDEEKAKKRYPYHFAGQIIEMPFLIYDYAIRLDSYKKALLDGMLVEAKKQGVDINDDILGTMMFALSGETIINCSNIVRGNATAVNLPNNVTNYYLNRRDQFLDAASSNGKGFKRYG
jgi:hypothetical protein